MVTPQEINLFRSMVLDNMDMAGLITIPSAYNYSKAEDVKQAVLNIGKYTGSGPKVKLAAMREKKAFYLGQLYILNQIEELINSYTTEK